MSTNQPIGRGQENPIRIEDPSVSSRHAMLQFRDGRHWIVDLGSTNGTFINGRRVTEAIVAEGDLVTFGTCTRIFRGGLFLDEHQVSIAKTESFFQAQSSALTGSRRLSFSGTFFAATVAVVVALTVFAFRFTSRQSSEFSQPDNLEALISRFRSGSVKVECSNQDYEFSGSGFPIATDSFGSSTYELLIVTNFHVIEDCSTESLSISTSSQSGSAATVKVDPQNDLALLRSSIELEPFPIAREAPIGSWVMAIGNPLGINGNVTFGTITTQQDGFYVTDAAINSGNSGGPLVNSDGQVVGVNVAKLDGADNIGFSIPISVLCQRLISCD